MPPAKAAPSKARAPMTIPAMAPPPIEELFFVLVVLDPEPDPCLLPPELELGEEDGEDGDPVVGGEPFVTPVCELESVFPADVACEPDEEVESNAEGEVVVGAPGPAFAA